VPKPKKRNLPEPLPLRITVVDPPPNILWALQLGRDELVKPTSMTKTRICFDFTVEVVAEGTGVLVRGPAVQGRLGEKFVYLCIGAYAGQADSPGGWRAKIRLEGITQKQVAAVKARRTGVLEARFAGTSKTGGPACATVPLLGNAWSVT